MKVKTGIAVGELPPGRCGMRRWQVILPIVIVVAAIGSATTCIMALRQKHAAFAARSTLCAHVAQSIADLPAMSPAEAMPPDGHVRDYDRRTSAALALSAVAVFCAAPGDRDEVSRLIFSLGSASGNGEHETPDAAADALRRMVMP